jgi:hypothetical protein
LPPGIVPLTNAQDDDLDEIFLNAVSEIDTQPLSKRTMGVRWQDVFQTLFCLSLLGVSLFGILWQAITYPHMLIFLYTREKPASLTTTLDIPTRTLAPVTVTRTATAPTTGTAHQDARAATGALTFYNGLFTAQFVPVGTVFTGADGVSVTTTESATVPASNPSANPPQLGYTTVVAEAVHIGAASNITAYDINATFANGVSVKNTRGFAGGRDARDYHAVAHRDLDALTVTTTQVVNQELPQAFTLLPGETLHITDCTTKTTADHAPGDEAQTLTVKTVKTCSAVAYSQDELTKEAKAAFTTGTRPAGYQLVNMKTSVINITPFQVRLTGTWAYTITQSYKEYLAEQIAGDTPQKARAYLLKTGTIAQANIPGTLPPAMYIDFIVLEEA